MKNKLVGVISANYGNISSVTNALKFLKTKHEVIDKPIKLARYSHLILPGVGSFSKAAKNLKKKGWFDAIRIFTRHKPLLGICLGMQLLFTKSTEDKITNGLNLLSGDCKKFESGPKKTLTPHMGFNIVHYNKKTKIWNGIPNNTPFYFVHNYRIKKIKKNVNFSYTQHIEKFISYVERNKIIGVQFHPEKSHKFGLRFIKNFLVEYN